MKKIYMVPISLVIMIVIFSGCNREVKENKYEETQIKMDTTMKITAYGSDAQSAVKDAFKRIGEIEELMSQNVENSDVNKINNAAGKSYVLVHTEVFDVIKKSIEYSKLSGGAFDITVGPITKLWGIGTKDERVPSLEEIKEKLPLVGYDKIKLNEPSKSVMLEKPGMMIDLGGIAKGYAAHQAVELLKKHGIKKAIVNLGGSSIYVLGEKGDNQPWSIGLQHPRKPQGGGYMGILKLSNKAISTSGDYERYFIKDGKRYHHIIDPKTGYPAESGIIADSVVIDTSKISTIDPDSISTAVFVLGPEKGMKLIESIPGLECVIATSDNRLIISHGLQGKISSISEDFKYDAQGR